MATAEPILVADLVEDVKAVCRSDDFKRAGASQAEALLEARLADRLAGYSVREKINLLDQVIQHMHGDRAEVRPNQQLEQQVFPKLIALILGQQLNARDLSPEVLYERLADSLNTVFDSLNELVAVIRTTLGDKREDMNTIRTVIGSTVGDKSNSDSLESYLGQIKRSFLVAHEAFIEAAQIKVAEILSELDPDHMLSLASGSGLGFGPFRKAELYEVYQEQYKKFQAWFTSGRFMEELIREFERRCQQLSK